MKLEKEIVISALSLSNCDVDKIENGRKDSLLSEKDSGHDIEEVYKIIGFGRVHWIVLLTGGLYLLMVINETLGLSTITMASQCDFKMNSVDKAVMGSSGFAGIIFSSYVWGYLTDVVGRRKILIYTTLIGNLFSLISMILSTYWPFVICRFLAGAFISGASSTNYAYIGEFFEAYYRPIVINYASSFVGLAMVYFPGISWFILSMDWSLEIYDGFNFRPWRLILLFYFLPGLIASIILIFLPETPKFFLSKNKHDEAYAAVDWVCRHSKGQTLADLKIFQIKTESNVPKESALTTSKSCNAMVKMWKETRLLFERPHVGNLIIGSVVMMAFFLSSSGMGLWYPTIQNRIGMSGNAKEFRTVCEILESEDRMQQQNVAMDFCDDTISTKTYIDSITIGVAYVIGFGFLGVFINPIGRKTLLIGALVISGVFCLALLWIKEPITILLSFGLFLVLPGLSISVLSGAAVDLMPTHLRAKGVCIVLMLGRSGSVIGSNIIGALLETQCFWTFSFFGSFSLLCAGLMFLLPI